MAAQETARAQRRESATARASSTLTSPKPLKPKRKQNKNHTKSAAAFHLDEFETALAAFEAGARLAPELPAFGTWARKCRAEIERALALIVLMIA